MKTCGSRGHQGALVAWGYPVTAASTDSDSAVHAQRTGHTEHTWGVRTTFDMGSTIGTATHTGMTVKCAGMEKQRGATNRTTIIIIM